MGQIVKRKKKGRPSKADLVAEKKATKAAAQPTEKELRRSGRRRNARYTLGFDDYLDDDEYYFDDDNEEDERRREKKLKLLLKLHGAATTTNDSPSSPHPRPPPSRRVVDHAPSASSSSASDDDTNPSKKRKLDGDDEDEDDYENDDVDDENNFNHNDNDDDDVEVKRRKREATKEVDSAPGTPLEPSSGFPLPDKKTLELILDKLQKKDRYSVYAQPVDPEELPDYHDVIEHPMDFSTIRKKLANGSYATLEQFKSDVFLLCSNAMQYNAPDTIYYKQAHSIQELAKKKFENLRMDNEPSEKELKSEQKPKSISIVKKQIRKSICRTVQEPVGSDFSSGATRATAGDFQNCSNAVQAGVTERPSILDGLIEGNASIIDTSLDKAEESIPGKGPISRFGRKISLHDENHRATYNTSSQPVASSESIFSTFDGESKLLIPVGLYVDNSYARSLARFAGTLGPVAWRVASKRIEQVLPQGTKFGRGWVGEYEPLPTPVLMLENCTIREPAFFMKPQHTLETRKDDKLSTAPVASKDVTGPTLGGKFPIFNPAGIKATTSSSTNTLPPGKEPLLRGTDIEGKPSFCSPGSTSAGIDSPSLPHQNSQIRNFILSKKVLKKVELSSPPSMDRSSAQLAAERQVSSGTEVLTPRSVEMVSVNRNLLPTEALTPRSVEMVSMNRTLLPCGSFKHPNTSGIAAGGLPNGKVISNSLDSTREVSSSSDTGKVATYLPRGQEQGLSDPVQLMRMLTQKNQNQLKSANQSSGNTPPVQSSAQSLSREDSGNATAAAARAWMSIGAGGFRPSGENLSALKNQISADSLYNPTHDLQPQVTRFRGDFPAPAMPFQPGKNTFPLHAFVPQPSRVGNAAQFQNRPMVFPQLVTADLSRFQVQSPWRSVNPQTQQVQKQETLPPDLNISFQSSGSPGRPSSGVLVDSQQPDLALQL